MIGLVYLGPHKLAFQDVPRPTLGERDVLLRVKACAICGSDVHGYEGITGRRTPPMIMGHEFGGVVEELGHCVSSLQPGDRVLATPSAGCGHCEFCRMNRPEMCSQRRVLGVGNINGALAEFCVVPAESLMTIPPGVSFVQATMVEPLTVAYHAFHRRPAQAMEDVALIGVGTIGLLLLQIVRLANPRRIFVSDPIPEKLTRARRYGATDTLDPIKTDVADAIMQATGGRGVDLAIEAVGFEESVQTAMAIARLGGDVLVVGNASKMGQIHLQGLVTHELRLIGTYGGTPEFAPALDLISSGRVDLSPFTEVVWPFERGIEAFERLAAGESGLWKVILTME
jgi:L-iditol 2-dehydrogenase